MKRWFIIFILLILTGTGYSNNRLLKKQFDQANAFYQQAQYDSALHYYETLYKQKIEHPVLLYNLGNTYLKLNLLPRAILLYEKAKKLAPRDPDIQTNLEKANLLITDKIKPMKKNIIIELFDRIINHYTFQEILYLSLCNFIILLTLCLIYIYKRFQNKLTGIKIFLIIFSILFILEIVWLDNRYNYYYHSHEAILMIEDELEVKVGPGINDETAFIIHSGVKFEILQTRGEWIEIRLRNGYTGWIPDENYQTI